MAEPLRSEPCTEARLRSPDFVAWAEVLRPAWDPGGYRQPGTWLHRKLWEYIFICQALDERGMLAPGKRGLGFGVGQEPLVPLFAARGCQVVASDLGQRDAARGGWTSHRQHADELSDFGRYGLCPEKDLSRLVSTREVNMNHIPSDLRGFDFAWSSCALEHLGSILEGEAFVLNQMRCLRPGGVAVHTTEFNVESNDGTCDYVDNVLFRSRDVERLAAILRDAGHSIELDLRCGTLPGDLYVDEAVLGQHTEVHLKVRMAGYVVTSLGLIIVKARTGPGRRARARLAGQRVGRQCAGATLGRLHPSIRNALYRVAASMRGR